MNYITVHLVIGRLEQESGFYFNMKHFEEEVQNGNWDEVEKYLSGFTKVDDNRYSMKIFFEIRKQKYLEALDKYTLTPLLYFTIVVCVPVETLRTIMFGLMSIKTYCT